MNREFKREHGYLTFAQNGETDYLRVGTRIGSRKDSEVYDLNVWPGDSGAAIFNSRGQIVGVVSSMSLPFHTMMAHPFAFTRKQWREATL